MAISAGLRYALTRWKEDSKKDRKNRELKGRELYTYVVACECSVKTGDPREGNLRTRGLYLTSYPTPSPRLTEEQATINPLVPEVIC